MPDNEYTCYVCHKKAKPVRELDLFENRLEYLDCGHLNLLGKAHHITRAELEDLFNSLIKKIEQSPYNENEKEKIKTFLSKLKGEFIQAYLGDFVTLNHLKRFEKAYLHSMKKYKFVYESILKWFSQHAWSYNTARP